MGLDMYFNKDTHRNLIMPNLHILNLVITIFNQPPKYGKDMPYNYTLAYDKPPFTPPPSTEPVYGQQPYGGQP